MWKSAAVPLAAVIALAVPTSVSAQEPPRRALIVTGTGAAAAAPDVAQITVGVETRDASAEAALQTNNRTTGNVIDALRNSGVVQEDIQTTELSIRRPQRDVGEENQRAPYVVTNAVRIVTDVDRLGETLDAAVGAGANTIRGIQFRIEDEAALRDAAMRRAVADARRKAEVLAAEAGVSLGAVVRIDEGSGAPSPGPLPTARVAMSPVPVQGGSQEITQSVTVTWRIED
jgi:hypothetical protein